MTGAATVTVVDRGAVLDALSTVMDPELDRDVVELGFVAACSIQRGAVEVVLRLPTYWCAPNFAWLMAEDARLALQAVPGVERVIVHLAGHHAEEEIAGGVNQDLGFDAAFQGLADSGLADLRRTFREKAFLVRLGRVLDELAGPFGVDLRVGDLPDTSEARAYLRVRSELGLDCSPLAAAITEPDGGQVTDLGLFRRRARLARVSQDANTSVCRALLAARDRTDRVAG
jgi:metal-sulfur cluster biosynthetic enzyme